MRLSLIRIVRSVPQEFDSRRTLPSSDELHIPLLWPEDERKQLDSWTLGCRDVGIRWGLYNQVHAVLF